MRIPLLLLTLLSLPAAAEVARIGPDSTVDAVLDALDARGQDLKDFSADVQKSTIDDRSGDTTVDSGKLVFENRPGAAARIKVSFDKTKLASGATQAKRLDYVLENGWLTDRDYQKKLEVRRQVIRPGQQINLLKLGEGPFPLPIGQKKEEVAKLFDVTKPPADKDDPKNTVHLTLKPKPNTPYAKRFKRIDVYVDRDTHFPARVDTEEKSQTSTSVELTNLKINAGVKDADFTLPDLGQQGGWNRREEPFE